MCPTQGKRTDLVALPHNAMARSDRQSRTYGKIAVLVTLDSPSLVYLCSSSSMYLVCSFVWERRLRKVAKQWNELASRDNVSSALCPAFHEKGLGLSLVAAATVVF